MNHTEALRLAISRLEDMLLADDGQAWKEAEKSMPILRAALAAPSVPSGEPVAWLEGPHGAIRMNLLWKLDPPPQSVAWSIPLYTAP